MPLKCCVLCYNSNYSTIPRSKNSSLLISSEIRNKWQLGFCAALTNGRLDLSLTSRVSEGPLKDHTRYDQGPEIHGEPRRVSIPFGEAQLAGCLRV